MRADGAPGQAQKFGAIELDRAALRRREADDRATGRRLAAAGFAHQRQRLAGADVEIDAFDSMHAAGATPQHPARDLVARGKSAHFQQRCGRWIDFRGDGAGRHRLTGLRCDQGEPCGAGIAAHGPQTRHGRQKRAGIGLPRGGKEGIGRALFDGLALVHDKGPVGDFGDHTHVMGDEQDGHVLFFLQHLDKLEDLRLDRDIQGCGRFVRDQQTGPAGQRHGDHEALSHPARGLVRVFAHPLPRGRDAHPFKQSLCFGHRLGLGHAPVCHQHLGNLLADLHRRVQRGHRLLEDHRHVIAAHSAHFGFGQG